MTKLERNFSGNRQLAYAHPPMQQGPAWRFAAAGLCASLFTRNNGDYLLLLELGGAAITLALAIDLIMALTVARKPPETRDDTGLRNH
jgi:hypothetical protein